MTAPRVVLLALIVIVSGCSTNSRTFHNQPLVSKVQSGMSMEQVEQIGGKPLAVSDRTVVLGTCYDYMFTKSSQRQPYNVSFDGKGKVDHSGFTTCAEWSNAQQKSRQAPKSKGVTGGAGY
ncbi:osmotically-inducible lipoprotein OsmE [Pseudomonas fontis]|uniref:Osmotically-inducible lipoprotein OsmE n=1 Tax=Pseudomonas fontis TaxID=2942633 RepID=A0ABT5NV99_9PSED|nr:osmotically-inducible lipoprotein OsmE [Pseudomonas fontis]MDD0974179.1 osmotically-inducible lipoprotein OsmE [Pseudomonas fontis]MDD0992059.1 osmotically-inducible lipoprotein OsmE [Pseudomonas fontis]